ncbi:MAG: acyl-CoA thioesterase [Rhodobacteraceae bacterium]|nr:acyl-CoA thioesterase [Paracoccaceae bacterium]
MPYQRLTQIEFNHCDPAGIVFYPRYFEMVNSVVENFFADVVGRSFAQMHLGQGNGVPTVRIEAEFVAPSRLGEKVLFTLEIVKLGGASAEFAIRAALGAEERMRLRLTLVWIEAGRAAPWPQEMRARMVTFMEEAA